MNHATSRAVWCGVVLLALTACGCRSDRPPEVPASAIRAASPSAGHTAHLQYTVPENGTIYLEDDWDLTLTFSGPVKKGDQIAVDLDAGLITINDKTAYQRPMRHTEHVLFFSPAKQ